MPDYAELVRALTEIDAAEARSTAIASREYEAAIAVLDADLEQAETTVRDAEAAVHAAERDIETVDASAGRLWKELAALLGWRGRWLGGVPAPAIDLTSTETARAYLGRARTEIARAAQGQQLAPIPPASVVLLPLFGAITTFAVVLPMRGIESLAGNLAVTVFAQILTFFAPFVGVPVLIGWVRHRHGAPPDIVALALTALGGMIASCAAALLMTG